MMNCLLFREKANRDTKFREVLQTGHRAVRSTTRGQLLHPMYIEDWPERLSEVDLGFGNTLYQTYHAVLYKLDWE